jgi:ABC-type oligopeptide transport system substrate-binding subunit/DNA-binding SARP family transcriptional activator
MKGVVQLWFLGTVEIKRDGEPVRGFRSRKALALLGYLAVHSQSIPRERLVDLFWEDKSETQGRSNLSWVLGRISSLLHGCLQADRHTVQLRRPCPYWLDVDAFGELEGQKDIASLESAIALYRGEFLEGMYLEGCAEFEIWLVGERERWHQRATDVLEELIACHSQRGEHDEALHFARRLLALEPWREETHRQVMRLLAWSGQRGAALAQYEACCQALAGELSVEPAAETTQLYERIRDGELETPVSTPIYLPDFSISFPSFLEGDKEPFEQPVFVAREQELERLDEFLGQALAGRGQVAFVTGDAGQGKTALIQRFTRRAQAAHSELVVAGGNGNAHTGVGDPYLPFREILGLLTGDVEARWTAGAMEKEQARRLWSVLPLAVRALVETGPDLIDAFLPGATLVGRAMAMDMMMPGGVEWLPRLKASVERKAALSGDPGLQRVDLFEQVTRVLRALARQRPLMLTLDDLQWADTGSCSLLFHLGRRIEGARILILGAYRPAEMAVRPSGERHPLASVVNELKRHFGEIEVDLAQAEGRQFVDAWVDTEPNRLESPFREALYRRTRGHPLSTVELLRGMQERGDLVRDEEGRWVEGPTLDWETLPARVEAVIAERINRLPEPLREVLQTASVEGETFTAEVVARAQTTNLRETVKRLSKELDRQHRLIHVQGLQRLGMGRLSRYRFRHSLFQRYLYNSLDPVERAYLHEAVGTALETLYGEAEAAEEEIATIAPQLAHHFQEAGIAGKAVGYLHQAGDRARGLYALQEAVEYYQRALEVLKQRKAYGKMARTLMKLGLTYHLALDFQRARQAYEEGFVLWQQVEEVQATASLPSEPHALRVDCPYLPVTLDPAMAEDADSTGVVDQLFSGLVELSPELEALPDVAHSWEISKGGQTYVFHLRDDVRWSDGVPVTAQDFEYAWKRVLNPATGSPTASLLYDIEGARAFHQGDVLDAGSVGVHALDEVTLLVELEQPTGYFLHLLAYNAGFPVPRHVVEAYSRAWAESGNIVTNGPFRLESWSQDEGLILVRNHEYHGHLRGNVERVELHKLSNGSARIEEYETDKLDVLFLRDLSQERETTRQRHAGEYVSAPWLTTTYIGFDAGQSPFEDPLVRLAFAHAVDKEGFADVVMQGYVFPATGGFVPPGMPAHSVGIGLPHDPDRARRLLAEAGYSNGRDLSPIELLTHHGYERASEYLASRWRESLGVKIAWQAVEWTALLERLEDDPPHIFLTAWYADYPDPDNFLRVCDGMRWTHWQNETYDRLVEKARRVANQQERVEMYRQADRTLVEGAAVVPFIYWRSHLLVKPWITRLPTSAVKWWFWKDVVIEPHV